MNESCGQCECCQAFSDALEACKVELAAAKANEERMCRIASEWREDCERTKSQLNDLLKDVVSVADAERERDKSRRAALLADARRAEVERERDEARAEMEACKAERDELRYQRNQLREEGCMAYAEIESLLHRLMNSAAELERDRLSRFKENCK